MKRAAPFCTMLALLVLVGAGGRCAAREGACSAAADQPRTEASLGAVRADTTMAHIVERARLAISAKGLSKQDAQLTLSLVPFGQPPGFEARIAAFPCQQPAGDPPESTTAKPDAVVQPHLAPSFGAAAAMRPTSEIPDSAVTRVLDQARQVELLRVAAPPDDTAGDLASFTVISDPIRLTDAEIDRLRRLLMGGPARWSAGAPVRSCQRPELMFEARDDLREGSFETLRIVMSGGCAAVRFLPNGDPAKSNGVVYYDDPSQPGLDGFILDIVARAAAEKAHPGTP